MSGRVGDILWYGLPPVLWMSLISAGSAIPSSNLPRLHDPWPFWAHRLTHFTEYLVLGVLLARAHNRWKRPLPNDLRPVLFLALSILLLALLDEWHQSFTPGRSPQLLDATFDTICATIGILMYRIRIRA